MDRFPWEPQIDSKELQFHFDLLANPDAMILIVPKPEELPVETDDGN